MEKELFDLLYDASKSTYDRYMYNVWTTMALAAGSIGWILTSNSARHFIGMQRVVRFVSLLCIALISVIHCIILFDIQSKSQHIHEILQKDNYVIKYQVSIEYYGQYLIPEVWPITSSIINGSLFMVLMLFIWLSPRFNNKSN